MLSSRSRPGSSSTRRIRPRDASGSCLKTLLWICTIFAFPDRPLDVRDRIELLLCLLKLSREPCVLGQSRLEPPHGFVVPRGARCFNLVAKPPCLGIENQPLLDLLQMDRDEHTLLGKQRRALSEQAAQALLCLCRILVRMTWRCDRKRKLHTILRRRRCGRRFCDFPKCLGLREHVAFDEAPHPVEILDDASVT